MDGNFNIRGKRKYEEGPDEGRETKIRKSAQFATCRSDGGAPQREVQAASSSSSSSSVSSACREPFKSLPVELIDLVFQFLPRKDLVSRVAFVDKGFHAVTQGNLGTLATQGRVAYQDGDYIEAARYFVNVSHGGASDEEVVVHVEEEEGALEIDFSSVSDPRDGLAKCLMKMRFLGNETLNNYSDDALMQLSHAELKDLWINHIEVDMDNLSGKGRMELHSEVYRWSCEASTGSWGHESVSPDERMHCCERISFLLLYSKDNAVRKDAMIALIRIAREMHGGGDLEKELVKQSIGNVVAHIAKSGELEALGGILKIVLENVKRADCSDVAKEALLHALNQSMEPITDELRGLIEKRIELREALKADQDIGPKMEELEVVEHELEAYDKVEAEVKRLKDEQKLLEGGLFGSMVDDLDEETLNQKLVSIHERLEVLKSPFEEILALKNRIDELRSDLLLAGEADEHYEENQQELAALEESLKGMLPVEREVSDLRVKLSECEDDLRHLKINARLEELEVEIAAIGELHEKRDALKAEIDASNSMKELHQVEARIATLDAFVQGVIKEVSINLAQKELSGDVDKGIALRQTLYGGLVSLCLANPGNEKTFKKLSTLFSYVIGQNHALTDIECAQMKDQLLELEDAYPSAERGQVMNIWLFDVGSSDIDFSEGIPVADRAMVAWLDRITGEKNDVLLEPFPLARIGRLAAALSSPQITLETRLRLYTILKPHLESLAVGNVRDPESLYIIQEFTSSAAKIFAEVESTDGGLDFQRELLIFVDELRNLVPGDWGSAKAVLDSLRTNMPELVYNALTAPVLKSD